MEEITLNGKRYREVEEDAPEVVLPETWKEFVENEPLGQYGYVYTRRGGKYRLKHTEKECGFDFYSLEMPTEELALAAFTAVKLDWLCRKYNNGWVPDWDKDDMKYVIFPFRDGLTIQNQTYEWRRLAFYSDAIAVKFLKTFKDLLEIAKPVL